jgi:mRNA interferase RelE/StbE
MIKSSSVAHLESNLTDVAIHHGTPWRVQNANLAINHIVAVSDIIGMKQVIVTHAAAKSLHKLPANSQWCMLAKVEEYAADPASLANNAKALAGSDLIRLRVGDWRVIMRDGVVLEVLEIGSRGSNHE